MRVGVNQLLVSLDEDKRHRDRHTGRASHDDGGLERSAHKPRNVKGFGQHQKMRGRCDTDSPLERARPCRPLDFGLLASRTVRE